MDACFICAGTTFENGAPDYRRCTTCGHETLRDAPAQTYMLNDPLDAAEANRPSFLDRFQDAVLRRFGAGLEDGRWVDVGSGSGKLLHRNRGRFARQGGVEITPAAVEYSRRVLGLEIVTDIAAVPGEIACVTAWHSLEHFPTPALQSLLGQLQNRVRRGGRVIVSVPNGASWQCRLFGERYPFHDVPNHLQQFTPDSLRRLFAAHGFSPKADVVSWPYNVFGQIQGLLNVVLRDHNHLYYRLKRGRPAAAAWREAANLLLLPVFVPVGLLLGLLESARPDRQAVLTCCFEKESGA